MSKKKQKITEYLLGQLAREFITSNYGVASGEQELLRLLVAVRDGHCSYLQGYLPPKPEVRT